MQNALDASRELQSARQAAVGHCRPQSASGQLSRTTADAVKQRVDSKGGLHGILPIGTEDFVLI
jgi:hypothetical protein